MEETKSMTVGELVKELKKLPQSWQVFTSIDPEGNAYGQLRADLLVGGSDEDKVICLMPIETFTDDIVMPKLLDRIMKELNLEKEK